MEAMRSVFYTLAVFCVGFQFALHAQQGRWTIASPLLGSGSG
jgi:hypothetical protein